MFDGLRDRVLRLMRVPHEPEPPAGAPGSIRVFRAGRNFYKLKLVGWGVGQVGALLGIIVSLGFLDRVDRAVTTTKASIQMAKEAEAKKAAAAAAPAEAVPDAAAPAAAAPAEATASKAEGSANSGGKKSARKQRSRGGLERVVNRSPGWVWPMIRFFEYAGIVLYFAQIPLTYAMVRLDWEQRWYIVTDRSLRIRTGLTTVLESTMSFANIQQVVVTQGPLQRLLGLADVRVQSAGGAGEVAEAHSGQPSLHTGTFHGVEHAQEIRDLILERLRLFRQAGLGDPDDHPLSSGEPATGSGQALAAAGELLAEVRELRAALRTR
jgi:hypothetical protein